MRTLFLCVLIISLGPLVAGCSGSTTFSEYAGTPRELLPKDHLDYQPPLHTAHVNATARIARTPDNVDGGQSLEDTFAAEDAHLRKVTSICRGCTSVVRAATAPSTSAKNFAQETSSPTAVNN